MEQISNRTLVFLLAIAIVISVAGTTISFIKISKLTPKITGMASTATGAVNVTIASVASVTIPDGMISFGSCSPNATTGANLSSNDSTAWGSPGVCSGASPPDNITIQNDGNKNVNVTVKSSVIAGASFIGGTSPTFWFSVRNASARAGCFNVTGPNGSNNTPTLDWTTGMQWNWRNLSEADTEYLACANLTYEDTRDQFSLFAKVFLPPDAPVATNQSATLTFSAYSW